MVVHPGIVCQKLGAIHGGGEAGSAPGSAGDPPLCEAGSSVVAPLHIHARDTINPAFGPAQVLFSEPGSSRPHSEPWRWPQRGATGPDGRHPGVGTGGQDADCTGTGGVHGVAGPGDGRPAGHRSGRLHGLLRPLSGPWSGTPGALALPGRERSLDPHCPNLLAEGGLGGSHHVASGTCRGHPRHPVAAADARVEPAVLPLGDGLLLLQKR